MHKNEYMLIILSRAMDNALLQTSICTYYHSLWMLIFYYKCHNYANV